MNKIFFIVEKGTLVPELGPYSLHYGQPFSTYEDAFDKLQSWIEDPERDYVNEDTFFITETVRNELKVENKKLITSV